MMSEPSFVSTRPRFKIGGQEKAAMASALLSLDVVMPGEGLDTAEIRLVNWGTASGGESSYLFEDINLGDDLEIEVGGETKQRVFKGHITAFEERYGEGAPHVVLLAEDALHKLARYRRSRVFESVSVDTLISTLASDAGLATDVNVSSLVRTFHQLNESDLALMRRVLAPFSVAPRLVGGTTLCAKPPEPVSSPPEISPARNGARIRILADLNRRATEVKVAGYDPHNGQAVSASAQSLRPAASGTTAGSLLGQVGWEGPMYLPIPFAHAQAEADALAQAGFNRRNATFVHGDITCDGDPSLAAGGQIALAGVADRLRGTYAITHCVHHYDLTRGYETFLRVARPDLAS
jgi:phage protein D